jgi:hypothetical protein
VAHGGRREALKMQRIDTAHMMEKTTTTTTTTTTNPSRNPLCDLEQYLNLAPTLDLHRKEETCM